ncbi:3735_t:CDS:1, partial [Scutellospora calospora]
SVLRCVGGRDNSRVMPPVFCLMTNKSEESYRRLFQKLIDFGEVYNIDLQPQIILTDFESTAINAVQLEFDNVQSKGCHFHLAQSVYHKVQNCGLSSRYDTNEPFSLLIRHIPALAFLPYNEIPDAFDELNSIILSEAHE